MAEAEGGMGHKLGPLPVWVWAIGAGALAGGVWFLRSRNSTPAPLASAAGESAAVDQLAVSDSQFNQLMQAIIGLYGPASTPVGAGGDGTKNGGPIRVNQPPDNVVRIANTPPPPNVVTSPPARRAY